MRRTRQKVEALYVVIRLVSKDGWCVVVLDSGSVVAAGRRNRRRISSRETKTIAGRLRTAVVPTEEALK